jgi:hypothetical protein
MMALASPPTRERRNKEEGKKKKMCAKVNKKDPDQNLNIQ